MTQQPVHPDATVSHTPTEERPAGSPLAPGEKASLGRVLRDQKKAIWVALVLAVASFWVLGQLDRWQLASAIAIGVLLGLANHLATELWLLRLITSGEEPTRNK